MTDDQWTVTRFTAFAMEPYSIFSAPFHKYLALQCAGTYTQKRRIFDIVFGIIFPLICFYVEWQGINIMFAPTRIIPWPLRTPLYLTVLICSAALVIHHTTRPSWRWVNTMFIGPSFLVGGFLALGMGVILAPMTMVGLIMIIGILGFVPFFTMFAYWRGFIYLVKNTQPDYSFTLLLMLICACLLILFIVGAGMYANHLVAYYEDMVLSDRAYNFRTGLDGLKKYKLFTWNDYSRILMEYGRCDAEKKKRLTQAYHELTEEDIESAYESWALD